MAVLGRERERAAIDRALEDARGGVSRTLVLQGAPGIGKSTLLAYARQAAPDMRVASATGIESEMTLAFAGLHQLLVPFLPHVAQLPGRQREALESAFGLSAGSSPDRFLVGLSVLTLLTGSGGDRPLLCVIDDAQWLDPESAAILAFVARRFQADHVALFFALLEPSTGHPLLEGLPNLQVGAMATSDARELLASVAPVPVDPAVAARLVANAAGSPLALSELAADLEPEQLAGRAPLPDPLPVGRGLRDRFARRWQALEPDAQTLLLLIASEPSGDMDAVRRAAGDLGIAWDLAEAPEVQRIVAFTPAPAFRHPLMRSAVYYTASAPDRRRAHRALAGAADAAHPERRAWHLAAATDAPDEALANELERLASEQWMRGAPAAAAALLARASAITPDTHHAVERTLAAAHAELVAGRTGPAHLGVEDAMRRATDDAQRARAQRLQGAVLFADGQIGKAAQVFVAAAGALQEHDHQAAIEALLEAEESAIYADRLAPGPDVRAIAAIALDALSAGPQPRGTAGLLLEAISLRLAGRYDGAAAPLRAAISAAGSDDDLRWRMLACLAAGESFDNAAWRLLAEGWVRVARERGALVTLPVALNYLAWSLVIAGRFGEAGVAIAELEEIASATGARGIVGPCAPSALLLHAWRGDDEGARRAAREMTRDGHARGQGAELEHVASAVALLELGLGHYEAALASAREVYAYDTYYLGSLVLPDMVEAAARSGDRPAARDAYARLAERAVAVQTDWALGLLARSRALLAGDDAAAEGDYQEGIAHLGKSGVATDLARAHLVYGEWLRRKRRRRDARDQLRAALNLFEEMGAGAFAQRARTELLATGEHARARTEATLNHLTPQELRVMQLAVAGNTDAEIGGQLFISANTVDYHLRKVFRKLGVTSRVQLARYAAEGSST